MKEEASLLYGIVELQTLDTTGTVWPERERFLQKVGVDYDKEGAESEKSFGMNWKMTAKTILVQLHHKIQTFEHINKRLVLVVQDCLLKYMQKEFNFDHLNDARVGDSMHMHSYRVTPKEDGSFGLVLDSRWSTDANGIAECMGLQADANLELGEIIELLEEKISEETLFTPA
jgi:hypothetical protein